MENFVHYLIWLLISVVGLCLYVLYVWNFTYLPCVLLVPNKHCCSSTWRVIMWLVLAQKPFIKCLLTTAWKWCLENTESVIKWWSSLMPVRAQNQMWITVLEIVNPHPISTDTGMVDFFMFRKFTLLFLNAGGWLWKLWRVSTGDVLLNKYCSVSGSLVWRYVVISFSYWNEEIITVLLHICRQL